MDEKDFFDEAKRRGLRDENIKSAIDIYCRIKNVLPNLELDENFINWMLKAQEKNDNRSDEFITLD